MESAPLRFLLSLAAITPGRFRFVGTARLGARPHTRPLLAALSRALGPSGLAIRTGDPWPIEVESRGVTDEPRFRVSGTESSQYASSLVLAAAAASSRREQRPGWSRSTNQLVSEGYLELTLRLAEAGWISSVRPLAIECRDPRLGCSSDDAASGASGLVRQRLSPPDRLENWRQRGGPRRFQGLLGDMPSRSRRRRASSPRRARARAPQPPWPSPLLQQGRRVRKTGSPTSTSLVPSSAAAFEPRGPGPLDLLPALAALACLLPDRSIFTEISRLRSRMS